MKLSLKVTRLLVLSASVFALGACTPQGGGGGTTGTTDTTTGSEGAAQEGSAQEAPMGESSEETGVQPTPTPGGQ
jgi:hypothetical protein